MRCAWATVNQFAHNDRQLQGTPGAIAVLHTHSRRLDYHPHVHLVVPAADKKKPARRASHSDHTGHRACVSTRSAPPSRRNPRTPMHLFSEEIGRAHV